MFKLYKIKFITFKTFCFTILKKINYTTFILKRKVESFLLLPFIFSGRVISFIWPLQNKYNSFFFFPFYHIGGAEKVHYQIMEAVGNEKAIIFFTRKSSSNFFLNEFSKTKASIKDISVFTDNKRLFYLNFIFRGIISGYINSQKKHVTVFNGQCNFGYKISPWINKEVKQYELIHALNTFAYIRLPYLNFYSKSITVSQEIIDKHKAVYQKNNVPVSFFDKFIFIESRIKLPKISAPVKKVTDVLNIVYAGRSTKDKRPWLFIEIANRLRTNNNIHFFYAGEMNEKTKASLPANLSYLGEITNEEDLQSIFKKSHIVVIPSATESGPLVFMEAMACGCAVIATPVGYMPRHIKNYIHGFLTSSVTNENIVIDEMVACINKFINEPDLLNQITAANIEYAYKNFSIETFYTAYRNLLQH